MVTLNHAVAVGMAQGPETALAMLEPLAADERTAGHHRLAAVRAHLLEIAGDTDAARAGDLDAARLTTSVPERRYLSFRAARLGSAP
jgi:predicted RNA polymerase sigma factor